VRSDTEPWVFTSSIFTVLVVIKALPPRTKIRTGAETNIHNRKQILKSKPTTYNKNKILKSLGLNKEEKRRRFQ